MKISDGSESESKIVHTVGGYVLACVGAFSFSTVLGAFLLSLAAATVAGSSWLNELVESMKFIPAILGLPLIFGPPHWYIMHSGISKLMSVLGFAFGAWLRFHGL